MTRRRQSSGHEPSKNSKSASCSGWPSRSGWRLGRSRATPRRRQARLTQILKQLKVGEQTRINLQRCSRASPFVFAEPAPGTDLFLLPLQPVRPGSGLADALRKQLGLAVCREVPYLEAGLPRVLYLAQPASVSARDSLLAQSQLQLQGQSFVLSVHQKAVSGRRRDSQAPDKLQVCIPDDLFLKRKIDRVAKTTAQLGSRFERVPSAHTAARPAAGPAERVQLRVRPRQPRTRLLSVARARRTLQRRRQQGCQRRLSPRRKRHGLLPSRTLRNARVVSAHQHRRRRPQSSPKLLPQEQAGLQSLLEREQVAADRPAAAADCEERSDKGGTGLLHGPRGQLVSDIAVHLRVGERPRLSAWPRVGAGLPGLGPGAQQHDHIAEVLLVASVHAGRTASTSSCCCRGPASCSAADWPTRETASGSCGRSSRSSR